MSERIDLPTPIGRLSYPKVWEAELGDGAKPGDLPKWSTTVLFTAEALKTPEWQAMVAAVMKRAREELGASADAKITFSEDGKSSMLVNGGKKSARMPFRKNSLGKYPDEIVMFINVNKTKKGNARPPEVLDRKGLHLEEMDAVYPGVRARAAVSVFTYKRDDGWGVSFGLNGVKVIGGGDRLDNFKPTADTYGALDGEEAVDDSLGGLLG